jgi:hypothetical protein
MIGDFDHGMKLTTGAAVPDLPLAHHHRQTKLMRAAKKSRPLASVASIFNRIQGRQP